MEKSWRRSALTIPTPSVFLFIFFVFLRRRWVPTRVDKGQPRIFIINHLIASYILLVPRYSCLFALRFTHKGRPPSKRSITYTNHFYTWRNIEGKNCLLVNCRFFCCYFFFPLLNFLEWKCSSQIKEKTNDDARKENIDSIRMKYIDINLISINQVCRRTSAPAHTRDYSSPPSIDDPTFYIWQKKKESEREMNVRTGITIRQGIS